MSRTQSVASGEGGEGAAEAELTKLLRVFRLTESERKGYAEQATIVIQKQNYALVKLREDNDALLLELSILQSRDDLLNAKEPSPRFQKVDFYINNIRASKDISITLDRTIEELSFLISKQRKNMGGINATVVTSHVAIQQVRVLENRLHQANVRFNKVLTENKRLRNLIDNLRRERLVFDTVHEKFEKELQEETEVMKEIIENSNNAYEARDEAQSKIGLLSEKVDKEYQTYSQEVKELDRTLEQDRKLKNFLVTKTADRMSENVNGVRAFLRPKQGNKQSHTSSSQDLQKASTSYDYVLKQIKSIAGVDSLLELLEKFKQAGSHNFSLFNYINQVRNEVERVTKDLGNISEKIFNISETAELSDIAKSQKINSLELELSANVEEVERVKRKNQEIGDLLVSLFNEVQALILSFEKCKVSVTSRTPTLTEEEEPSDDVEFEESDPTQNVLDESVTINPLLIPIIENPPGSTIAEKLIRYLAVLEQKCSDILILNQLTTNPRKLASAGSTSLNQEGEGTPAKQHTKGPAHAIVVIVAPNTNDDSSDEDEDDSPLDSSELKSRILRGLSKKHAQNGPPQKKRRTKKGVVV